MSSCAVPWEPIEFEKEKGELFHKRGSKVWLVKDPKGKGRVTVNPLPGKPFGVVAEDSLFPNLWVKVRVWNKVQWLEFDQRERNLDRWEAIGIKGKIKLPWKKQF